MRAVVACLLLGCSYTPPKEPTVVDPDASEAKLDAPPVTSCTAGQTFCNGRELVTCNASGTGLDTSLSVQCPLTCEAAQCVAASHVPDATQITCQQTPNPVTFMPGAGAVRFDDNNGTPRIVCDGGCGPGLGTSIDAIKVPQSGGPEIAFFCLRQVLIPSGITVDVTSDFDYAAVLFALADVVIDGQIDLSGSDGEALIRGDGKASGGNGGDLVFQNFPGDDGGGACRGEGGNIQGTGESAGGGGGGGGGNVDVGGNGGDGRSTNSNNVGTGGLGGGSCASSTVLVGGGGGGGGADGSCGNNVSCGWPGGGGGGALQIATAGNFQLGATGRLISNGGDGEGFTGANGGGGGGGGGAGGTFLVEARGAQFVTGSQVTLRGGEGGRSNAGSGGQGAEAGQRTGGDGADQDSASEGGAGGGGAGGRIRVHTVTAATVCDTINTNPTNVCTSGTLRVVP